MARMVFRASRYPPLRRVWIHFMYLIFQKKLVNALAFSLPLIFFSVIMDAPPRVAHLRHAGSNTYGRVLRPLLATFALPAQILRLSPRVFQPRLARSFVAPLDGGCSRLVPRLPRVFQPRLARSFVAPLAVTAAVSATTALTRGFELTFCH